MAACHAAAHNTIEAHSPARWGPQPASGTYEDQIEPTSGESAKERHEAAARPWAVPAAVTSVALVYGSWALIAKAAIEGAGASPLVLAAYRCCGGSLAMLLVHRLCGAGAPGGAAPAPSRGLAEIAAADRPRFVLLGALMACNVGGNIPRKKKAPAGTHCLRAAAAGARRHQHSCCGWFWPPALESPGGGHRAGRCGRRGGGVHGASGRRWQRRRAAGAAAGRRRAAGPRARARRALPRRERLRRCPLHGPAEGSIRPASA
ncbi:unnamed protein product [Prorocentrum cordatum]|uniref:EamA domain-containing protein n=1 Tax=Prorocentrum cordatum TaxID=2364126 RepID=A0ABN9T6H8_9DINO|nr:unnamed protein product [Polarella glacialis]